MLLVYCLPCHEIPIISIFSFSFHFLGDEHNQNTEIIDSLLNIQAFINK